MTFGQRLLTSGPLGHIELNTQRAVAWVSPIGEEGVVVESDQRVRPAPERQRWFSLLAVWVTGIILLNLALLFVAFKVEQIFKDFKVTLPGVTKVLVQLSRAYRVPTGARTIISGSVGVIVLMMVMKPIFGANVSRRAVWLSALFWLAMLAIVVGAILVPLLTLMAAVSGRK